MALNQSDFDDLLQAACAQVAPQRLLFVFAQAVLPDDCSEAQRAAFAAGDGGALAPLMSVDKTPAELAGFAALVAESQALSAGWAAVFVASLGGRDGSAPTTTETARALEQMIDAVGNGRFGTMLAFNREGGILSFA